MDRPNILLLMTDEQRGDALGGLPGSLVDTPYLNQLRTQGIHFTRAYSACPVCVPARRTLMTGKTPAHHGVMMNYTAPLDGQTLPDILRQSGYQTHLSGKLHLFPERKRYGFESADWADASFSSNTENDYERFLKENGMFYRFGIAHGMHHNGYAARPFHMEEKWHYSTWCTDMALRFLERRDPTAPFFLNVSYYQPHAPCTPPAHYFYKYLNSELPEIVLGDWEEDFPNTQNGHPVNAWRVAPNSRSMREYRAGYYGCVEQIDHQIGRILHEMPENTVVFFLSDHGEMLGDHGWIRKRSAYEGSANIPLIIWMPDGLANDLGIRQGTIVDTPVELMDILPTILDLLDIPIPQDIDGISLLPSMQGNMIDRSYIHGECARLETIGTGMQYVTDGKEKYIWYPALGKEQFFDLLSDPRELHDLAKAGTCEDRIKVWRSRLIQELNDRPEGFIVDGALRKLDAPTPYCISESLMSSGCNLKDTDNGESSLP